MITRKPRARLRAVFAVLAATTSLLACATIAGLDDLEIAECKGGACGPDTSAPVEAGRPDVGPSEDAGVDATLPPCTSDAGPGMVRVGDPTNSFCIDSTEVTVADYKAFVAAAPDASASSQIAECAWNTSYEPSAVAADGTPQVGIDWCDAYAYCAWAGKRLCGKVENGRDPGSKLTASELASAAVSQWFIACSNGGKQNFPYGGARTPGACNFKEADAGKQPVPSPGEADAACMGGYDGIYDMLGNVWEWIDYCQAPDGGVDGGSAKMECYVRGGSFTVTESGVDCRTNGVGATRDGRSGEIGFRCCSE